MTAIAVIKTSSAAYMFTDGAALDAAGALQFSCSKVLILPHLKLAMAVRGNMHVGLGLMSSIGCRFGQFDELRPSIVAVLRELANNTTLEFWKKQCGHGADRFDITFAGWSDKNGPECFFVTNVDRGIPSAPPWTYIPWEGAAALPADHHVSAILSEVSEETFIPELDGIRLVGAQRKVLEPHGLNGVPTCIVGSFIQLTTVTKSEISSRIIYRWPNDRIGERLRADG